MDDAVTRRRAVVQQLAIIAALFVTACTPLDVVCPVLPFDEGVCVLKDLADEAAVKRHTEPNRPPAPWTPAGANSLTRRVRRALCTQLGEHNLVVDAKAACDGLCGRFVVRLDTAAARCVASVT